MRQRCRRFWIRQTWAQILAWPLTGCMTLGKWFHQSRPQFSHPWNGSDILSLTKWFGGVFRKYKHKIAGPEQEFNKCSFPLSFHPRFLNVLDPSHLQLGAPWALATVAGMSLFDEGREAETTSAFLQQGSTGSLDLGPNSTRVDCMTAQHTHIAQQPAGARNTALLADSAHLSWGDTRPRDVALWSWPREADSTRAKKQKQERARDFSQASISNYLNQTKYLFKFVIQKMYSLLNAKKSGHLRKRKKAPLHIFSIGLKSEH